MKIIMEIPDNNNDETGRKWQDEINSGFDRLVAYATEVDKRRKSTDSSNNSPVRPNSGLSHEDLSFSTKTTPVQEVIDDVFESSRNFPPNMSNNSVKLKSAYSGPRGVVSANSPYARTMPVHNSSKSVVPSALAS